MKKAPDRSEASKCCSLFLPQDVRLHEPKLNDGVMNFINPLLIMFWPTRFIPDDPIGKVQRVQFPEHGVQLKHHVIQAPVQSGRNVDLFRHGITPCSRTGCR